jgi:hypothetical protein
VNPARSIGKRLSFYKLKPIVEQIAKDDHYSVIENRFQRRNLTAVFAAGYAVRGLPLFREGLCRPLWPAE